MIYQHYEEMNEDLASTKNDHNTFLYKNIILSLTVYFSKGGHRWRMCERDRETERDKDRLQYPPITSSSSSFDHTTLCYIQGLTSLLLLLPDQGPLRAIALYRAPGGQFPWLTISRPKTPDWRLTPLRFPVSAVGLVYIISQRPRIPVISHVKCFRLFTQVHPAITLFTQLEHPALLKVNIQQKPLHEELIRNG